jgi:replicative superfamily II helicase
LLLLDEVHLLGDSSRGCCLETVICRMKMVQNVDSDIAEHDELEHACYKR